MMRDTANPKLAASQNFTHVVAFLQHTADECGPSTSRDDQNIDGRLEARSLSRPGLSQRAAMPYRADISDLNQSDVSISV